MNLIAHFVYGPIYCAMRILCIEKHLAGSQELNKFTIAHINELSVSVTDDTATNKQTNNASKRNQTARHN